MLFNAPQITTKSREFRSSKVNYVVHGTSNHNKTTRIKQQQVNNGVNCTLIHLKITRISQQQVNYAVLEPQIPTIHENFAVEC